MTIRPKGLSEWRRSLAPADSDSESYRGDEGRVSSWRWLRTVSTAFAFVIPVVAYLWLISRYGVNSFFADQWSNLALIGHSYSGTLSMGVLWAQHGDHRMFFPESHRSPTGIHHSFQHGVRGVLSAAMLIGGHRARNPDPPAHMSVASLDLLPSDRRRNAVLGASRMDRRQLPVGFPDGLVSGALALATSLYLLDSPSFNGFFLLGAIAAATVGSYSSLQGLLIWIAGLVVLYKRGRPLRSLLTWIACGIAVTALYFYNFTFGTKARVPPICMVISSPLSSSSSLCSETS